MANQQRQLEAVRPHVRRVPSRPTQSTTSESDAQTNEPSHGSINVVKWGLGCTGIAMLLITGAVMFVLIVTPAIFRSLKPAQQDELVNTYGIKFLAAFMPTRAYTGDVIPTANSDGKAAFALLASPVASPTVVPDPVTPQGLDAGNMQPVNIGQNIQSTLAQTPILATNTPVISTALPTPTLDVTATPPSQPTAIPAVETTQPVADAPVPAAFYMDGVTHVQQGWNGCGPANLTQALKFYGWPGTKEDAQAYLKPNREGKNVSPWRMVDFVNGGGHVTGLKALYRMGGDLNLLKRLVSNRFAVIVEKGSVVVDEGGWMGHYLTIVGYNDVQHQILGMDTWLSNGADGKGRAIDYDEFDGFWHDFNRLYIVVYPDARERELAALLGPSSDFDYSVHNALSKAKVDASSHPDDGFAWFNVGTNYVLLGQYKEAALAFQYAQSLKDIPWRMLWYQFGPYEAYYHTGDFNNVLNLAQATLQTTPYVEETFYWQGMAMAALGNKSQAISSFQSALGVNPNFTLASESLQQVQDGTFKVPIVAQNN